MAFHHIHIFLGCRVSSSDPWWSWDSLSQALQCQWREVPPLLGLDPRADGCDRNKQTCRSLEGTQTDQLVLTLAKPRAGFRQSRRQHSLCWSSCLSWMWFELSWEGRTLLDCVSPLCLPWNRPAGVKCYCLWCLKTLWPREKFPVPGMSLLSLSVLWKQFPFTHFLNKCQWNILFSKSVSLLSGDSLSSFLKWLKSLLKLLAV